MPESPFAVLCDYDDTTAVENVAELILERFGHDGWRDLRLEFRDGRLSLREYQERAFAAVTATCGEMMALVQEQVHLRSGFKELRDFCRAHLMPLAIVTNGLDFYVRALLEREGLADVPFYSVETSFTSQGIRYSYPYADAACPVNWGNCKCLVLDTFRRKGYRIAYVGDGRSDFCPALRADLVFARSSLRQHCLASGIPFVPFEDFHTVLAVLKEVTQEVRVD